MALTGQPAVAWDPQRSFAGRKNNSQGIIFAIISCQRVKGKIVSEFFSHFHTFSEIFPQDFPLRNKGF